VPTDPNKQRVAIRYTAEDGNTYRVITSRNHAAAIGATGALAADPPLPTKWKPRVVYGLQVAAGRDKKLALVAPLESHALWLGTANTFTVAPYGTFTVTGRSGETRTQGAPGYDGNANPPNERVSIRYQSDNGQDYSIVTTRSHAAAVGATDGSSYPAYPEIWTPRHYNLSSTDLTGRDQKMVLVEGNDQNAPWVNGVAYDFTVGGQIFRSTGRRQESRTEGAPSYVP